MNEEDKTHQVKFIELQQDEDVHLLRTMAGKLAFVGLKLWEVNLDKDSRVIGSVFHVKDWGGN